MKGYLAIDQGTTSSRALIFDQHGDLRHCAQMDFAQSYPASGWVEHDPEEIWRSVCEVGRQACAAAAGLGITLRALGIANQRETTVVWERASGRPVAPAIVWQDRRTAELCARLIAEGHEPVMREKTGLILDPYFSATKIAWILDHVPGARQQAEDGLLAFGTIDSFLLWRLTEGRVHVTDASNASRTGLMNLESQQWDSDLLALFRVPPGILPEICDSQCLFGETTPGAIGARLPILAVLGDQQAAAVGQGCFTPGAMKSTYGTGCFILLNHGSKRPRPGQRLLATVCYRLGGEVTYACEGAIFTAGAVVQWLRDGLGIIPDAAHSEALAASLTDNAGVYLVPAFTGLGAPHWDSQARGLICGLSRASNAATLARAALESVAYQTQDLLAILPLEDTKARILRVDGGMTANAWLMQFLADISQMTVERPRITEATARGVAMLAALGDGAFARLKETAPGGDGAFAQLKETAPGGDGAFAQLKETAQGIEIDARFQPRMTKAKRDQLLASWHHAVARTRLAAPTNDDN